MASIFSGRNGTITVNDLPPGSWQPGLIPPRKLDKVQLDDLHHQIKQALAAPISTGNWITIPAGCSLEFAPQEE
jgi:hypothetical protein